MRHDDRSRILLPQFLEAILVQAFSLIFDAPIGHAHSGKIFRIEELGAEGRAGSAIWVSFNRNLQTFFQGLLDHRDSQWHVAKACAVQVTDVNVRASRSSE